MNTGAALIRYGKTDENRKGFDMQFSFTSTKSLLVWYRRFWRWLLQEPSVYFSWYYLMVHTDFAVHRRGSGCCPGALQYIDFPFFFWFNFLMSRERVAYINSLYISIHKFVVVLKEVQISKRRVCICLYFSGKMKNLRFQRPQPFCFIIVIATNDLEALYATSIAICSITLATNLFLLMAGMNQSPQSLQFNWWTAKQMVIVNKIIFCHLCPVMRKSEL